MVISLQVYFVGMSGAFCYFTFDMIFSLNVSNG